MKNKHTLITIVAAAGIFVLGLFAGVYVMCFFSMNRQKDERSGKARTYAEEYASEGRIEENSRNDSGRILIYDRNGNLTEDYYFPGLDEAEEPMISCEAYLKPVLKGKTVNRLQFLVGRSENLITIVFITGAPVYEDGQIIGGLFYTAMQYHFGSTVLIFIIYYAIVYVICAVVIILTNRKREKLDFTQKNYIANVTHALKTPIASVKALAETVYDGMVPDFEGQREYMGLIMEQADLQTEMVNNILNLSKIQSRTVDLKCTRVKAADIFVPLEEKYSKICSGRNIKIEFTDNIGKLTYLNTNIKSVTAIMENLLDNAVKFLKNDGNIVVDAVKVSGKVQISVRDNGPGFNEEDIPFIFERFYMGKNANNSWGSGLGLAIARELADSMKEKIWAKNNHSGGSEIIFTLTLAK